MRDDKPLREHLLYLLTGEGAHPDFEAAIKDLPRALRGERASGLPHSPWELLEHMRIAQGDILEYTRKAGHVSPSFPDGYWPGAQAPPDDAAWNGSVEGFRATIAGFRELVETSSDLLAPVPHAQGTTIMGQVLLALDHNAYHLGQLVLVRRLLGAWQ